MKEKKTNKVLKKTAPLAKSLGEMMKDEDGFVSKETILKVGLSTIAALGMAAGVAGAHNEYSSHQNVIGPNATNPSCVQHTNVTTHSSY